MTHRNPAPEEQPRTVILIATVIQDFKKYSFSLPVKYHKQILATQICPVCVGCSSGAEHIE